MNKRGGGKGAQGNCVYERRSLYNIIFNSRKGTGGDRANLTYSFDFGNIPDGEYHATFSYMGEENDLSISASHDYKVANVYMNLGKSNDYEAGNTSGSIQFTNSNFMGFLDTNRNTNYSYLYSKHTDNSPVFINSLANSQVNIRVQDSTGALYLDSGGVALNHYVLVLHLELVKEYDTILTKQIEERIEDEYEYQEVEVEVEEDENPSIPKIFESI